MNAKLLALIFLSVALVSSSLFCICKNTNEYFQQNLFLPMQNHDYIIRPYGDCPDNIKKNVVDAFQKEWGTDTTTYNDEIISLLWKQPDVLFVMTDKRGIFIGTSGIDRNYYYPFISHLFVMKDFRNKGYGTTLLNATESYGTSFLKSDTMSLWCKEECVDFYKKRGWSEHGVSGFSNPVLGNTLMTKKRQEFA